MLLKVCGATTPSQIDLLADAGVDMIGLWWRVHHGRNSVTNALLAELVQHCRTHHRPDPVVVTLSDDVDALARIGDCMRSVTVQLHAYQPPRVVSELRAALPGSRIVKVLHVDDGGCPERRFIGAYERAGVDAFLVDRIAAGRVGSTGRSIGPDAVAALLDRSTVPFLLAGGVGDVVHRALRTVLATGRIIGVDVDSRARDEAGRFDPVRIARIRRAWVADDALRHPWAPRRDLVGAPT